ncbi:MAG: RDD family protein [Syntrophus sp. (in: bacteria)]|nr:RDD family protein [Syntrophus sp. (in: bacteria)]
MTEERFGGFWRRAAAYGIDKTILQIFYIILFVAGLMIRGLDEHAYQSVEMDMPGGLPDMSVIWIYYLIALFLDMIYFTWFHGAVGQTPGKMMLGLRVVQATGAPMTFGLAFLRWVGYLISKLAVYLGFIWVAFDRRKQGWHDKIAATVVVTVKKGLDKESYII